MSFIHPKIRKSRDIKFKNITWNQATKKTATRPSKYAKTPNEIAADLKCDISTVRRLLRGIEKEGKFKLLREKGTVVDSLYRIVPVTYYTIIKK